jgi:chorismate dehydratase
MKKVITADNSESFLNLEVNETYHSQTGAVEEALKKYSEPCKIRKLAKTGSIKILDMFFGMGYNSAMAVSEALKENPDCEIEVIAVEKDRKIISKIQEVNPAIEFYKHYKKLNPTRRELKQGNITIKILLGDAREVVKKLQNGYFDAIFYDPFSPKTAPEMWEVNLFKEMCRVIKDTGVLATYSCARVVRENMATAGFFYDEGPVVGRRGPGTIATKWL